MNHLLIRAAASCSSSSLPNRRRRRQRSSPPPLPPQPMTATATGGLVIVAALFLLAGTCVDASTARTCTAFVHQTRACPSQAWTQRGRRQWTASGSSSLLLPLHSSLSTTWDRRMVLPENVTAATSDLFSFPRQEEGPASSSRTATMTKTHHQVAVKDRSQEQAFRIFCDLDGVLVDFEHGIKQLFPDIDAISAKQQPSTIRKYNDYERPPFQVHDLHRGTMWKRVQAADAFFENLPWCPGGKRLWESIRHLQPDILTGVPSHRPSRIEKVRWCQRELFGVSSIQHFDMAGRFYRHASPDGRTPAQARRRRRQQQQQQQQQQQLHPKNAKYEHACHVITCWSHNKYHESGPGAVLIDDRISLKANWEAAGGIFVHHRTGDAESTLRQLYQLGILEEEEME